MFKNTAREHGLFSLEAGIAVCVIFSIFIVILYVLDYGNLLGAVKDLKLSRSLKRLSEEIQHFSLNGKFPSCSDIVGAPPKCSEIVFGGVKSCNCPYFTVEELQTGILPYSGIKFTSNNGAYCISAVANNQMKGKYLKIDYPRGTEPIRSEFGC